MHGQLVLAPINLGFDMTQFELEHINWQLQQLSDALISLRHADPSSLAQWVAVLRKRREIAPSANLDSFLKAHAVTWWPTPVVAPFPRYGDTETAVCQPYVTARISEIMNCGGRVHRKKIARVPFTSAYVRTAQPEVVNFVSQPVDAHGQISFSTRRPDVACYYLGKRAPSAITILGNVRGWSPPEKDFPDVAIGHIIDMGQDLMTKQQFTRDFLYCFLTDGNKFQFFRCVRQRMGDIWYEQSAVYVGEKGWQVQETHHYHFYYCNIVFCNRSYQCCAADIFWITCLFCTRYWVCYI